MAEPRGLRHTSHHAIVAVLTQPHAAAETPQPMDGGVAGYGSAGGDGNASRHSQTVSSRSMRPKRPASTMIAFHSSVAYTRRSTGTGRSSTFQSSARRSKGAPQRSTMTTRSRSLPTPHSPRAYDP